jgi:hypothetical protein
MRKMDYGRRRGNAALDEGPKDNPERAIAGYYIADTYRVREKMRELEELEMKRKGIDGMVKERSVEWRLRGYEEIQKKLDRI